MKRTLLAVSIASVMALAGAALARAEAPMARPVANVGADTTTGGTSPSPMAKGGMMGRGMMMGGGGMGMCPMMLGGADTTVDVKDIDKGVTITLTSSDPATVKRVQKMAQAMRLMHEAMEQ